VLIVIAHNGVLRSDSRVNRTKLKYISPGTPCETSGDLVSILDLGSCNSKSFVRNAYRR
jgi:hypothetical protein